MYKIVGRLMDGNSVIGYVIQSDEVPGTMNVRTADVEVMAQMGTIYNVKATSEGLTGTNGFKLRELPSMQMHQDEKVKRLEVIAQYIYSNTGTLRKVEDDNSSKIEASGRLIGWRVRNPNKYNSLYMDTIEVKPNEELILTLTKFEEIAHKLDKHIFDNVFVANINGKEGRYYLGRIKGAKEIKVIQTGIQNEEGVWDLIDTEEYKRAFGAEIEAEKEAKRKKEQDRRMLENSARILEVLVFGSHQTIVGYRVLNVSKENIKLLNELEIKPRCIGLITRREFMSLQRKCTDTFVNNEEDAMKTQIGQINKNGSWELIDNEEYKAKFGMMSDKINEFTSASEQPNKRGIRGFMDMFKR